MDFPGEFILRAEGMFCRKYNIEMSDVRILNELVKFDAIPKSRCQFRITFKMVQFVSNTNGSDLIFDETKQLRTETTFGRLALSSIRGRKGGWCVTNNKHFIARMAGYNTWKDFENAGEKGIWSEYYNMTEKTMARRCNIIKRRIATTFSSVQFRESQTRRGWEFNTNSESEDI